MLLNRNIHEPSLAIWVEFFHEDTNFFLFQYINFRCLMFMTIKYEDSWEHQAIWFSYLFKKETIEGKMGLKLNGWFEICWRKINWNRGGSEKIFRRLVLGPKRPPQTMFFIKNSSPTIVLTSNPKLLKLWASSGTQPHYLKIWLF
jgi:hypothetical protein